MFCVVSKLKLIRKHCCKLWNVCDYCSSENQSRSMASGPYNYSYIFKYIIIGDMGVGKSCLLHQFTEKKCNLLLNVIISFCQQSSCSRVISKITRSQSNLAKAASNALHTLHALHSITIVTPKVCMGSQKLKMGHMTQTQTRIWPTFA